METKSFVACDRFGKTVLERHLLSISQDMVVEFFFNAMSLQGVMSNVSRQFFVIISANCHDYFVSTVACFHVIFYTVVNSE